MESTWKEHVQCYYRSQLESFHHLKMCVFSENCPTLYPKPQLLWFLLWWINFICFGTWCKWNNVYVWFLLLNLMLLKFIHSVKCMDRYSILLLSCISVYVYTTVHLKYSHFVLSWVKLSTALIYTCFAGDLFIPFMYVSRKKIPGTDGSKMFKFT